MVHYYTLYIHFEYFSLIIMCTQINTCVNFFYVKIFVFSVKINQMSLTAYFVLSVEVLGILQKIVE